jgi:hypothetical protein
MNANEKQLVISLIRALEDLLIESAALTELTEEHRIPPHVRKAFVATMRNDPLTVTLTRARVQPLYDQIEHAADVAQVVGSLLAILRQRAQE